jgi:hypothetical protein
MTVVVACDSKNQAMPVASSRNPATAIRRRFNLRLRLFSDVGTLSLTGQRRVL